MIHKKLRNPSAKNSDHHRRNDATFPKQRRHPRHLIGRKPRSISRPDASELSHRQASIAAAKAAAAAEQRSWLPHFTRTHRVSWLYMCSELEQRYSPTANVARA